MKPSAFLITFLLAALTTVHAAPPDLSKVSSLADLDAVIAATADAPLKQALTDNADAILAAAEQHPHVVAVIRTIESAPGTFTKINATPEALKKAAGGDLPIFDTLTEVRTSIKGGGAHDHRKKDADPYNAAFIEHLGNITSLEKVYLEATAIEDAWVAPLLKLKNLKKLTIVGFGQLGDASLTQLQHLKTACPHLTNLELTRFGKATDAGWEQMAGLTNLESFSFQGLPLRGHFFAKFKGWTKLKSINFHSNGLDDEGMGYVCENFPNLEIIKLWHSKLLTDASAGHLGKLSKLKGIEIGCKNATAALFKDMAQVPLEYAALAYGVSAPASEAIANLKSIPTLRRLKIECDSFSDADLTALASVTQVKELTLGNIALTDDRLPQFAAFAFLKTLSLAPLNGSKKSTGLTPENQAKIKALLPGVEVGFVQ